MTSNKIKKLVVSFFSNMNLFNQHKTEKEVREGLNFVPIEEIFKFLGVRWSLAENGYICFGKLFGGLIIQWGIYRVPDNGTKSIALPIAFPKRLVGLIKSPCGNNANTGNTALYREFGNIENSLSSFKAYWGNPVCDFFFFAIGY